MENAKSPGLCYGPGVGAGGVKHGDTAHLNIFYGQNTLLDRHNNVQTLNTVEHCPADISSPKRPREENLKSIDSWYSYYAGFTSDFVQDVLSVFNLPQYSTVLDPWNGAGTTTSVASDLGFFSFGNDLNPAMNIISKSRLIHGIVQSNLVAEAKSACASMSNDLGLLTRLYPNEVAISLRSIREGIAPGQRVDLNQLTSEKLILLTSLFATARAIASPLKGSNPTWWKCDPRQVTQYSREAIFDLFVDHARSVSSLLEYRSGTEVTSTIRTGDAKRLDLDNTSIDAIVTSPPYLTRIDYALAMLPELAILGFDEAELRDLRISMLGSVMGGASPRYSTNWGTEAKECLRHTVTAARTRNRNDASYYKPFFARYFDLLYKSMKEMNRVLKPGGQIAIVVQPSRHRGKLIDLPLIVSQMGSSLGWQGVRSVAWSTRDLGRINPRSKQYTQHKVHETAVLMRKP